jgi:hypothetical protein
METLEPGFNKAHGYELPPFPDSPAIRWGNAFEEAVIKLAEEKFNDQIKDREKTFTAEYVKKIFQTDETVISCHIDGAYQNMGNGLVLHEGKTTNHLAFKQVKEDKLRWGEPGTDEIPEEYQCQAAIQRICTGADLVKLSVLVFPKTQEDFENEGWIVERIFHTGMNSPHFILKKDTKTAAPDAWARTFAQIGNFHTYNLPTNQKLESELTRVIQDFDARYVKTKMPPKATDYGDIWRLLKNPIGTIEATPEILKMCHDHIELGRQLGSKSPLKIRREKLKVEICNFIETARKKSYVDPATKTVIIDPNGGDVLASLSKDKNGTPRFWTREAD